MDFISEEARLTQKVEKINIFRAFKCSSFQLIKLGKDIQVDKMSEMEPFYDLYSSV